MSASQANATTPPPVVPAGDVSWTASYDVIVVGFGGAGACAALEAVESGASVMAIDKFTGGGATAISGGVFYTGGGSSYQQAAGVEDSVDNMYRYLRQEIDDVVDDATLRDFCDQSLDNLSFLETNGVPFEASLCPYKTSYPTDDYYLYYSGNESFTPYRNTATPAPRGHRAKGTGLPGANFYEPLRQSALAKGVTPQYQTSVTKLVTDGERVVGVEARVLDGGFWGFMHRWLAALSSKIKNYVPGFAKKLNRRCERIEVKHGVTRYFEARQGVILSAGGFIYNRAMVEQHAPNYRKGMPLGTPGCNGSGILLGQSVGGTVAKMGRVSAWRFINPPEAWVHGMIVNRNGERYVNERLYGAAIGEKMVDENDGQAILIIDQHLKDLSREQVSGKKVQWFQKAPTLLNLYSNCKKGETIEEVAKVARVDADGLKATLEAYNTFARGEADDAFGKSSDYARPLENGPYYAINCSLSSKKFPCPTLTLGGLRVDEGSGAVQREDGSTVPGLYAAGRTALGVASDRYVSGLSLADCVYSGRRAGRSAAEGSNTAAQAAA